MNLIPLGILGYIMYILLKKDKTKDTEVENSKNSDIISQEKQDAISNNKIIPDEGPVYTDKRVFNNHIAPGYTKILKDSENSPQGGPKLNL